MRRVLRDNRRGMCRWVDIVVRSGGYAVQFRFVSRRHEAVGGLRSDHSGCLAVPRFALGVGNKAMRCILGNHRCGMRRGMYVVVRSGGYAVQLFLVGGSHEAVCRSGGYGC